MDVSRIAETSQLTSLTAPKSAAEESEKKASTLASDNTDKFVKSETTFTPAYTKGTAAKANAESENEVKNKTTKAEGIEYKRASQIKNELMQSMVSETVKGQASKKNSSVNSAVSELAAKLGFTGKAATALAAAEATSEGLSTKDYWGADATAERLLTFAKSLAGDDKELFGTMKKAFETAFSSCEKSYGGKDKLPSVCYDTYDKVISGFDDWEKELSVEETATE